VLQLETVNEHVRAAQYAVRGELAIRAEKLKEVRGRAPPTPLRAPLWSLGATPCAASIYLWRLPLWPSVLGPDGRRVLCVCVCVCVCVCDVAGA
jgi:hypothetical protein